MFPWFSWIKFFQVYLFIHCIIIVEENLPFFNFCWDIPFTVWIYYSSANGLPLYRCQNNSIYIYIYIQCMHEFHTLTNHLQKIRAGIKHLTCGTMNLSRKWKSFLLTCTEVLILVVWCQFVEHICFKILKQTNFRQMNKKSEVTSYVHFSCSFCERILFTFFL